MSATPKHHPTRSDYTAHEAELKRLWGRPAGGPFWEEIEPAFQFGWVMACDPALVDHAWAEVETRLADRWFWPQSASEEMAWDQVRDAVHLAWDLAHAMAPTAAEPP
jgi:hypothetical protein